MEDKPLTRAVWWTYCHPSIESPNYITKEIIERRCKSLTMQTQRRGYILLLLRPALLVSWGVIGVVRVSRDRNWQGVLLRAIKTNGLGSKPSANCHPISDFLMSDGKLSVTHSQSDNWDYLYNYLPAPGKCYVNSFKRESDCFLNFKAMGGL